MNPTLPGVPDPVANPSASLPRAPAPDPALFIVDAFARAPFGGNPAAVCLLGQPVSEEWMQRVAAEMNLSETAFVAAPADGVFGLRWFTPAVEVDLCGHATLASAHALWEAGRWPASEPIVFATRKSGRLICQKRTDGWIMMDFPSRPVDPVAMPPGLREALGCEVRWIGRSEYDYLVEVSREAEVRELRPDFARLAELPVRGVMVTAAGAEGGGYDCVSRFFAPAAGVMEDPVTGSAHCSLAPFWAGKLGKTELRAWQASQRGGELRLRLAGNRVELLGQAWTVLRGQLSSAASPWPRPGGESAPGSAGR